MNGGTQLIDKIEIDIIGSNDSLTVYIDVWDTSLSRKWLSALNTLLKNDYHLEKNYCFFGFANGPRNGDYLCDQINRSIQAINSADLDYKIDDCFDMTNVLLTGPIGHWNPGGKINREKFNNLHRYFEDLQGVSGAISHYYQAATPTIKWHIRQLNLLCHEFESWALSNRMKIISPEWQRPSQLMCWLNAPRFTLDEDDLESFGIDTLNRPLGGVYVGVNKAIGKHHWEVFVDEADYNANVRIDNLTTTAMRKQVEASGDFDIEWAKDPKDYHWQKTHLADFRIWLQNNGFDPDDKSLTIGHPQCGQVNLDKSFGTSDYEKIWDMLAEHMDVREIRTSDARNKFEYHWSDDDYISRQITILQGTQS